MIFGTEFDKAKIEKSKISVVLNYGGSVKVNNYLDSKYMYVKIYKNSELFFFFFYFRPLPVHIILEKAESALGRIGYNVIYNNCEHFATDCRYGQSNSRQVRRLI